MSARVLSRERIYVAARRSEIGIFERAGAGAGGRERVRLAWPTSPAQSVNQPSVYQSALARDEATREEIWVHSKREGKRARQSGIGYAVRVVNNTM